MAQPIRMLHRGRRSPWGARWSTMLKMHWFLPTGGDSRDVLPEGDDKHWRPPSHEYLAQIATACDQLGYEAMLTPCGTGCEDAWLATASLIPITERIKFLVAFRPGFLSPTLAAQMASTYQRMSNGRLLINIVTGAEPRELNRFGDWLDKDSRYARTGEFLQIMGKAWTGEPYDFEGDYFHVAGGDHPRGAATGATRLLRWGIAGSQGGGGGPRRRLPHLG